MAILLQIWSFVRRHAGEEVFDELVGDEGVAEVELGYVWLRCCQLLFMAKSHRESVKEPLRRSREWGFCIGVEYDMGIGAIPCHLRLL